MLTPARRFAPLVLFAALGSVFLFYASASEARPKALRVYITPQFEKTHPGGYGEVEAGMENLLEDRTVYAKIRTTIVYLDGRRDTVMRWRRPLVLEPDQGFSAFILFAVPKDAPIGTAEVVTVATIYRVVEPGGQPLMTGKHPYVMARTSFEVKPKGPLE